MSPVTSVTVGVPKWDSVKLCDSAQSAVKSILAWGLLAEAKFEALDQACGEAHSLDEIANVMERIERATSLNEFCAYTKLCGAIMGEDDEVCPWCGGPRREA